MNNFTQNIALFTAPAVKSSRKIFQEYGLYVFSNNSESNFKAEIYEQATHIWLGERFECKTDEWEFGKYIKISLVWEILETGSFEIDFQWEKITKIFNNSSTLLSDEKMLEYMQKFIENSTYCKENWELANSTERKWRFIYANPGNIIQIQEDILYPSKSLISFGLNLDEKNNYIPTKELVNTLHISKNVFLDLENNDLLVKNFSESVKKWEILLANNLKKVPFWDTNNKLYVNIMKILHKNPNGFNVRNFEEFANIRDTDFSEKIKAFNRGSFADYLDFALNITSSLYISKKNK